MRWSNLEHKIHQEFPRELVGSHVILAVSGGLDSVVLLNVINRIHHALKISVSVAYVHHGGDSWYRSEASDFVRRLCEQLQMPFSQLGPAVKNLQSEEECRKYRRSVLQNFKNEINANAILTAHHRQDVLETRLIRLIRGTGLQGLPALQKWKDHYLRPFLSIDKTDLEMYAQKMGLDYLEDPSNQSETYLRNWIRRSWLPALEARSPGSTKAVARSLESIIQESHSRKTEKDVETDFTRGFLMQDLLQMTAEKQRMTIASYLKYLNAANYSQNHIKEILKHLDKPQKVHSFQVLGFIWSVNAGQVSACLKKG